SCNRAYAKRMGIEQMLRDCKRGGYHLERTGLKGTRLITLLLVLTLAYGAATFVGQKLRQRRVTHYIARSSQLQRSRPRHSYFYTGLYAYGWVNFVDTCADLVNALLQLSPGKRPFYQRGQRAMSLVRSPL
ncbi:IS4 family transposase, partial [Trichocoleus desertorum AS-A10]